MVSTTRTIIRSSSVQTVTPTNSPVHPVHVTPDTTTTTTEPTTTTATSVMSTSSTTELEFHMDMVTTVRTMDTVTMLDTVMVYDTSSVNECQNIAKTDYDILRVSDLTRQNKVTS